ncbi:MAG: hypothetical protein M3Y22_15105 [Pseudomonadota bacterium]|nr:hypothetical protein [Pseudomonadota bacterium]
MDVPTEQNKPRVQLRLSEDYGDFGPGASNAHPITRTTETLRRGRLRIA